jgi:hypothetical protein
VLRGEIKDPRTGYIAGSQAEQAAVARGEIRNPERDYRADTSKRPDAESSADAAPIRTPGNIGPIGPSFGGGGGGAGAGALAPGGLLSKLDESDKRVIASQNEAKEALKTYGLNNVLRSGVTGQDVAEHVAELSSIKDTMEQFRQDSTKEQQAVAAHLDDLAKQAAAAHIDPERYWNSKSTAQKVGLTLAMALGEFGSHMPHVSGGGQSAAVQMIRDAMSRDVDAQKADVDNKWKAVSEGTALAKNKMAQQTFIADQLDRMKLLSDFKLKAQLMGLATMADSDEKRAKVAAMIAELDGGIEQRNQQMEMRRYQMRMSMMAGQSAYWLKQKEAYRKYVDEHEKHQDAMELEAQKLGGKYERAPAVPPRDWLNQVENGITPPTYGTSGLSSEGLRPQQREAATKEQVQAAGERDVVKAAEEAASNVPNYANPLRFLPTADAHIADKDLDAANDRIKMAILAKAQHLREAGNDKAAQELKDLTPFMLGHSDTENAATLRRIYGVLGPTPYSTSIGAPGAAKPVQAPLPGEKTDK